MATFMVIQLKAPKTVITVTVGLFFFKLLFYKVKSELFCCCLEFWLIKTSFTFLSYELYSYTGSQTSSVSVSFK